MASSRRHKAKTPPDAVPRPDRRPGIWARYLALFQEKPLEALGGIGALGTTLGAVVTGLGFVTLRAREELLGLSPGLSYPKQEWLVTGLGALGALLSRGLSVLVSDHVVLQRSAWALLLLLALVIAARATRRRPALLLGVLAMSALLLAAGSSFYRIALAATSSPDADPSQGFHCGDRLSVNLADRAAFETCSWLVNDTARNDGRRRDLGGLLGWLVAACCVAAVTGARAAVSNRWLSRVRWALVGTHAILAALLLFDLPRAHAFGTWGLRYPQVRIKKECDESLARAILSNTCQAFDVSARAETKVVFLQGPGCPDNPAGEFPPFEPKCLIPLSSPPRVIAHGPNP